MSPRIWGRGRGDRDEVLAGMELMRWGYRASEWQQLVDAYRTAPSAPRRLLSAGTAVAGAMAGALFGAAAGGPFGAIGGAALGAAILSVAPLVGDRTRRGQAIREMDDLGCPEVVFTSHGFVAGNVARLWRGSDYWLVNVWLFRTGPLILELIFNSPAFPLERIKLPIPTALEQDVTEMVAVLQAKVPHQRDDDEPRPPPESCRIGPGPKVC